MFIKEFLIYTYLVLSSIYIKPHPLIIKSLWKFFVLVIFFLYMENKVI